MKINKSPEHNIDADLILKIKRGDREAFSELFLKYHKDIKSFFSKRCHFQNHYEVEDYTQEVFFRLWQKDAK